MLEGLEISEVLYSLIEIENRYDSEYFKRVFLDNEKFLSELKNTRIGKELKVTDGEHGSVIIRDHGIKYLTAENIKKGYVDISNIRYVDDEVNKRNKRAEVHVGDVLISIKGTLGEVAIAEKWLLPANMNRDVAILKPLEDSTLSTSFVALFLMTKFGAIQSLRGGSGGVQQMITLGRLRKFIIPVFSSSLYSTVDLLYNQSQHSLRESASTYFKAENLLLDTLGLSDFQPSEDGVNVKSFKDSFLNSGRLDSEYYLKKYEQIVLKIKSQKHNTLSNLVNIKKSIEPGAKAYDENKGVPFVRVADLTKHGINTPSKNISDSFYKTNESKLNKLKIKEDTVLLSKDGSVGISYAVKEDLEMITSGAILHLLIKEGIDLLPEYLSLVLNSQTTQLQAERDAGGSIILHWRVGEIKNVLIPLLDIDSQKEIQKLVTNSFDLRSKSESLLEISKRGVELAIEQNEKVAMEWMSKEIATKGIEL